MPIANPSCSIIEPNASSNRKPSRKSTANTSISKPKDATKPIKSSKDKSKTPSDDAPKKPE